MKKEVLYDNLNGTNQEAGMLRTLKSIEETLQKEITSKQAIIHWQQDELRRLQSEVNHKNDTVAGLTNKLHECHSQSEGNRQLINKLITDIDKLHQDINWYKRTYETRSLFGVIKDKLKYFFK